MANNSSISGQGAFQVADIFPLLLPSNSSFTEYEGFISIQVKIF